VISFPPSDVDLDFGPAHTSGDCFDHVQNRTLISGADIEVLQYSVEGLNHSYGHNEAYDAEYPPQAGDYSFNPQEHHDAYYNQPYEPSPSRQDVSYWQDDPDTQPILQSDTSYGPNPQDYHDEPIPSPSPAPMIRRWKTVKEVQLFNGNLVLDCPVPPRLLNQVPHVQPPERDEFTHMRYSAATCDPSEFVSQRFTLRQKLFAKPRHTELFIVVTMYNEEDELFARTMIGVIKNIEFMNSRTNSKTWGKDAWKKIVVCIVSDGRAKINKRTRAVLAALGVYQEGIAKQQVNKKDVTAHIYEVRPPARATDIRLRFRRRLKLTFCSTQLR
jgi:chitin synthase